MNTPSNIIIPTRSRGGRRERYRSQYLEDTTAVENQSSHNHETLSGYIEDLQNTWSQFSTDFPVFSNCYHKRFNRLIESIIKSSENLSYIS